MIEVQQLEVTAGDFQLSGVDLSIATGEYCALMGKTGTGKTTLLEAICGLREVSGGSVYLMNELVTQRPINQRGIGLVPQELALFPTKTVGEHLSFGPKLRKWSSAEVEQIVLQLSDQLKLTSLLDKYPKNLSGGEKQRTALGRALSIEPSILCLDEPFSALDDETRQEMILLIKQVVKQRQVTVLHITHNESEAKALADRIVRIESLCRKQT